MGTGISSILLKNLPYQFKHLDAIADAVFVLNVVLFCLFLIASVLVIFSLIPPAPVRASFPNPARSHAPFHFEFRIPNSCIIPNDHVFRISLTCRVRYTLWPTVWTAMIHHPTQSLFIGTFPMGLCTIVNMIVFSCVPAFGERCVLPLFLFSFRRAEADSGGALH